MIRVVLTGAECTGKSTLATALSGHYGEPCTKEFAREYVNQLDRELTPVDVEPIAKGQLAQEDNAMGQANRFILHDTNLLSTIIYANHYYGKQLSWLNDVFLRRDYALYLLCSPEGIDWKADPGQRDSPEAREKLHLQFKHYLGLYVLPYVSLEGCQHTRFRRAVMEINKLLPEKGGG
ncbi:MAG: AAA family ATPase [Opitutales bacterium]